MNEEQRIILEEAAKLADQFVCLKNVYLFGSVVRGDTHPGSDVDIAFDYADELYLKAGVPPRHLMECHIALQPAALKWADNLEHAVGRKVHIHRDHVSKEEDYMWPAIKAAGEVPLASIGKALMVWTEPKPR